MPWKYKFVKGDKMPHKITKHGKIVGQSATKAQAMASIRARYAAENKKRKK